MKMVAGHWYGRADSDDQTLADVNAGIDAVLLRQNKEKARTLRRVASQSLHGWASREGILTFVWPTEDGWKVGPESVILPASKAPSRGFSTRR